jgi:hypothetical protein
MPFARTVNKSVRRVQTPARKGIWRVPGVLGWRVKTPLCVSFDGETKALKPRLHRLSAKALAIKIRHFNGAEKYENSSFSMM